jgi:TRC40/GET3/ArsA family transport-energizing ATPase
MSRRALASAFNMEGGFNDVSIATTRGANDDDVIAGLDGLLEPYGGFGATPRSVQVSAWMLDNELRQLQTFGFITPAIFLGVAAFILNGALARALSLQRSQIAALKALGYANQELAWHYVKWALAIAGSGALAGVAAGAWLGSNMIGLYNEFFRFPALHFHLSVGVAILSVIVSLAAALADAGRRVLLVSTDPASNLDEVLGVTLSTQPTTVPTIPGLSALTIDPDAAAHEYRERVVGPYRTLLPAQAVARIEEQLSGACTVEIAAFDQFTSLLADPGTTAGFDHVIFDTAPTGHTLRPLTLPGAWTGFIETNTTGTSCLGPLAGLQSQRDLYRASLAALADSAITTVILVARPEPSALAEAARTSAELAALGVTHQSLIINGVFTGTDPSDPVAGALEARGRAALAALPGALTAIPRLDVPLLPWAPKGAEGLRHRRRHAAPPRREDRPRGRNPVL